jgi:hypothetical protein
VQQCLQANIECSDSAILLTALPRDGGTPLETYLGVAVIFPSRRSTLGATSWFKRNSTTELYCISHPFMSYYTPSVIIDPHRAQQMGSQPPVRAVANQKHVSHPNSRMLATYPLVVA